MTNYHDKLLQEIFTRNYPLVYHDTKVSDVQRYCVSKNGSINKRREIERKRGNGIERERVCETVRSKNSIYEILSIRLKSRKRKVIGNSFVQKCNWRNNIVASKMLNTFWLFSVFFWSLSQYCHSYIGLFSIAPHIVIDVPTLREKQLLFLFFLLIFIRSRVISL